MKKKQFIVTVFLAIFFSVGFLYLQRATPKNQNQSFQKIMGRESSLGKNNNRSNTQKSNYRETVQVIDQAWDNITEGDSYAKAGQFQQAAIAYEKAYSLDRGSRAVSGFSLAETYEKLDRYDNAITQLNQMIQKGEFSKLGIQDANNMINRLLATKTQAAESAQPQ